VSVQVGSLVLRFLRHISSPRLESHVSVVSLLLISIHWDAGLLCASFDAVLSVGRGAFGCADESASRRQPISKCA